MRLRLAPTSDVAYKSAGSMRSAAAFDALLQHMPVGLIVWQLDDDLATLRVVCANPAAEALCGVALSEQLGKTMAELFPNGQREHE